MQTNKISSRPPEKKFLEEENFILAAENKNKTNTDEIFPWENPSIRHDVKKAFTVELQEEYIAKIKFLKDKTNKSQQSIIREIICKEVDKMIDQLK